MKLTNEIFDRVYELVLTGMTINKACKKAGIWPSYFYKNASKKQKALLRQTKAIGLKEGSTHSPYWVSKYDTANFIIEEDD